MTETEIPGYDIVSVLGRGETATVYCAVFSGQPVALKVLDRRLSADPAFLSSFREDLKVAASLVHPNIGRVYACGSTGGDPFIASEFVEGESLRSVLRSRTLTPEEAGRVLSAVGAALDYAREQGMLHHDVQPANILFREDGEVLLVDFGLARCTRRAPFIAPSYSLRRAPYVAPEVCQGREPDFRSDLYSLGVVLWEMLAGRPPFDGPETLAVYAQHVQRPPGSILKVNPALPRRVQRVLDRALAKDPKRRYGSGTELARDFLAACGLEGRTVAALPAAPPQPDRDAGEESFRAPGAERERPAETARRAEEPVPPAAEPSPKRGTRKPLSAPAALIAAALGGALVAAVFFLNRPGAGERGSAPPPVDPVASVTVTPADPVAPLPAVEPEALRTRLAAHLESFEQFDGERLKLPRSERQRRLTAFYEEVRGMLRDAGRVAERQRDLESELYRELGTIEWYRARPGAARHHWRKAVQLDRKNTLASAWLNETQGATLNE